MIRLITFYLKNEDISDKNQVKVSTSLVLQVEIKYF